HIALQERQADGGHQAEANDKGEQQFSAYPHKTSLNLNTVPGNLTAEYHVASTLENGESELTQAGDNIHIMLKPFSPGAKCADQLVSTIEDACARVIRKIVFLIAIAAECPAINP
ncbi:MAG: hypothetical protein Q7U12_05080, partial [Undibacterium sp.]|nr:hypothetical protein [Undibacterium sp.]